MVAVGVIVFAVVVEWVTNGLGAVVNPHSLESLSAFCGLLGLDGRNVLVEELAGRSCPGARNKPRALSRLTWAIWSGSSNCRVISTTSMNGSPTDRAGLEAEVIRYMVDSQEEHFDRLGLAFNGLRGRRLQLIDCQNLFCEVYKYARVAHPDVRGIWSHEDRADVCARRFALDCLVPPKWNLNGAFRPTAL